MPEADIMGVLNRVNSLQFGTKIFNDLRVSVLILK